MPVLEIKGQHLAAEYRRVKTLSSKGKASTTGEAQASSIMRSLRAALKNKLLSMEVEVADPFVRLNKLVPGWYKTKARTNIVAQTDGDLERWWKGVEQLRAATAYQAKDSPTIADYLILSLLFGGRLTETLSLKWSDVSMRSKVVRFRAEVTKPDREHLIPFGPYAEGILQRRLDENLAREMRSQYVFNASRSSRTVKGQPGERTHIKFPKKAINRVGGFSEMKFTSHDIRRTFGSLFAELPVSDATVEKALNHAAQTTARRHYIQSRLEPLRQNYIMLENAVLKEAKVKIVRSKPPSSSHGTGGIYPKARRNGSLA
jgi:integrase